MYQIDFQKPLPIHFIGIGGISMSGLAEILLRAGFPVSGSDAQGSALTERLADLGARICIGQRAENLGEDCGLVVYTAAIREDNPELREARARCLPLLTRAELLGEIMANYRRSIAVAGTHGKTSTTSMLSHILLSAGEDPTISVGGILPAIGGNIRVGRHDIFLAEACEYTNSFLSLAPTVGIILNVDADHLDFFKDLDDIAASFRKFAEKIPAEGTLVIGTKTSHLSEITEGLPCRVVTFGPGGDYDCRETAFDKCGFAAFSLLEKGQPIAQLSLRVPGAHNVQNALAAVAAARAFGVDYESIAKGLLAYDGVNRRFQEKGTFMGAEVFDDYAHHPAEIAATLAAARIRPHRKLWVAFQPHTYSRTLALLPEFASALAKADHVLLLDIYAAREKDDLGISSRNLRDAVAALGTDARYFPTFEEVRGCLLREAGPGDIILTMGAGSITLLGDLLAKG